MGLGDISNPQLIFKRKYRWKFEIRTCAGLIPSNFVKLASRPNISIEETEINFLNGKTWIPGKGTWETITVTYYDVAGGPGNNFSSAMYGWLNSVYEFTNPVTLRQASKAAEYGGNATLTLYDGCGNEMENWQLLNVWPQAINFGDLDYSSSEEVTIELTLRYTDAKYTNVCGRPTFCGCTGC